MGKKIVFFDIDGTLVNADKQIPASTKKAIEQLKERGVIVALSTGRPPYMYEHIRQELGIDTYVSFTGQHVVFEGELIHDQPIDRLMIQRLYENSIEEQFPMMLMSDTEMVATIGEHPHMIDGLSQLKYEYPPVHHSFHEEESIYQVLLFIAEKYDEILKDRYSTCQLIRWDTYACDLLPGGGSKIVGVNKVLEAAQIDNDDAYAFGDGFNDLEMIEQIGTGIAMGNAVQPLKNVAKLTTDDVNQGGVWNALKKLALIK